MSVKKKRLTSSKTTGEFRMPVKLHWLLVFIEAYTYKIISTSLLGLFCMRVCNASVNTLGNVLCVLFF